MDKESINEIFRKNLKTIGSCYVLLKRYSKQEIINDYDIDYTEVTKYYDMSGDKGVKLIPINDNIYDKCVNQEKCLKLSQVFDDSEKDVIYYKSNTNDYDIQSSNRKSSRKRSQTSDKKPKKLKNTENRPKDGKSRKGSNNSESDIQIENQTISKSGKKVGKAFTDKHSNKENGKQNLKSNKSKTDSEIISYTKFMGTRYQTNDLIHACNDCENHCQVDELTLAFHLMMTSPEDELPFDLNKSLNIVSDSESDPELNDNDLNDDEWEDVFPEVDDVFQQSIEDDIVLNDPNISLFHDFISNIRKSGPN